MGKPITLEMAQQKLIDSGSKNIVIKKIKIPM